MKVGDVIHFKGYPNQLFYTAMVTAADGEWVHCRGFLCIFCESQLEMAEASKIPGFESYYGREA